MVNICCAYGCSNVYKLNSDIHFFRSSKTSRICGTHFLESDFEDPFKILCTRKRLKKTAVPCKFDFLPHLLPKVCTRRPLIRNTEIDSSTVPYEISNMDSNAFLLTLMFAAVTFAQQEKQAIVVLTGPKGVEGNITFTQLQDKVSVVGMVKGLERGLHGFHIHEKGDLRSGCTSTGSHFNPENLPHGGPHSTKRHIGDLGNIEANEKGVATLNFTDDLISLKNGKRNIIGRAVVVHANIDDLGQGGHPDSLTTGNAGGRVACGVIGRLNVTSNALMTSVCHVLFVSSLILTLLNSSD